MKLCETETEVKSALWNRADYIIIIIILMILPHYDLHFHSFVVLHTVQPCVLFM